MRVRRCSVLYLEPAEETAFDITELLTGGDGLRRQRRWLALAPHLDEPAELAPEEVQRIGEFSPTRWTELPLDGADETVARLIRHGLLLCEAPAEFQAVASASQRTHRERDDALRRVHWHPLAAALHAFTRWEGVDAVQNMRDSHTEFAGPMREFLGPPPPETVRRVPEAEALPLPRPERDGFDALLARRVTCRNFDPARPLPLAVLAQLLQRVFAVQAQIVVSEDTVFLKKHVPSGGGLHPLEAYLLVQQVDGLDPGLYHYQAVDHALEPLGCPGPESPDPPAPARVASTESDGSATRELAMEFLAQQHWFADAHVIVLLTARFGRTFWKYRQHAKAYRVVVLEAGHVSQTLYLAATEAGLGAFVTGAINERAIERVLGLEALHEGVIAACGFGWRGRERANAELDPNRQVWD